MASEKLESAARRVRNVHLRNKFKCGLPEFRFFRTVNILKMTMKTINGEGNAENA